MKYRKLDENGDMKFGSGGSDFHVDTPEAVAQAVTTTLKLFQGEWFINTSDGVPYFTKIFGFGNMGGYDFEIKKATIMTKGVVSILDFSSFVDENRNAKINATIETLYGRKQISIIL